jgi:uncharacterized protein (DUF1330 family)
MVLKFNKFFESKTVLNTISYQEAIDKKLFGPVYHGTTQDRWDKIHDSGFKIFIGQSSTYIEGDIRHGYGNNLYYDTGKLAPIHHLGYGVYFTKNKTTAKSFNNKTTTNLKEFFIDLPRLAIINFASHKKMMQWWEDNGYDPELALTNRIKATEILTNNLKEKYDGVYFLGKSGMYKALDGDQIVVFDPSKIYLVDKSLSKGTEIGAKIKLIKDLTYPNSSTVIVPKGTIGIVKRKSPAQEMRDYWIKNGNDKEHWTKNSEYVYTITFNKGGTHTNILDEYIIPLNNIKQIKENFSKKEYEQGIDVSGNIILSSDEWNSLSKNKQDQLKNTITKKVTDLNGNTFDVDFNIAPIIQKLNDLGFSTGQSDSGTLSDHPNYRYVADDKNGKYKKGDVISGGSSAYLSVWKPDAVSIQKMGRKINTQKQIDIYILAAKKSGWIVDNTELFTQPSIRLNLPYTKDGTSRKIILEEANDLTNKYHPTLKSDDFMKWIDYRNNIYEPKIVEKHGGQIMLSDSQIIQKWNDLVNTMEDILKNSNN